MTDEIEFTFSDEARKFLLKQKCPTCSGEVYVHRNVDDTSNKEVSWTVECSRGCHKTRPVSDRRIALDQFKMIRRLVQ